MKKITLVFCIFLLSCLCIPNLSPAASENNKIAHGKYLVARVGMCTDCHSPRNEKGEFITEKWLEGGVIDFVPTHPMPNWASRSPALAGLPGWNEAEMIRLMETAMAPGNVRLNPPMPAYKMNKNDATAVVAYLKSLKAEKK